jgi:hypothetical protein
MAGIKHDKGKPDFSLIPLSAMVAEAEAFMVGEAKYGRYNYTEGGLKASQLMRALMSHALRWFNGEERDPDGQTHLGAVRANAAMLIRLQELKLLVDDRHKGAIKNGTINPTSFRKGMRNVKKRATRK